MKDQEFVDKMFLLCKFDNPAYVLFNNKHTLMIQDGKMRLLVFSKELQQNVFIPCSVSIEQKKITKGDRSDVLITENLASYRESKEKHRSLGGFMDSI